jgi:hypothetical protein
MSPALAIRMNCSTKRANESQEDITIFGFPANAVSAAREGEQAE